MDLRYIDIGVDLMGKQFDKDREEVVRDPLKERMGPIITGTSSKSNQVAVDYTGEKMPEKAWRTCGIHPHNADRWNDNYRSKLEALIHRNRQSIAALRKAGLDYGRMLSAREDQKKCSSDILEMAGDLDLPLFLHERTAEQDSIRLLKNRRELCRRFVVHCFAGTRETVYRYLQLGCYTGITGWIYDDWRNRDVVEVVRVIPLERLMIGTDAPYLTPLNIRGLSRRNVSSNIVYVAERIAEIKGVDVETVKKVASETTRTFFSM